MANTFKLCILLLMFISNNVLGQSYIKDAHPKAGQIDFNKILTEKLKDSTGQKAFNLCAISVVFAKFTIDIKGNVKNISFLGDKNCPIEIKDLLISVIKQTNGTWIPTLINNKKTESKPFILPLIYRLQGGCPLDKYENKIESSIMNMLYFDANEQNNPKKPNYLKLDCFLLQPLNIISES
jgi:hypothetical protein